MQLTQHLFQGSFVALVTPFRDGKVDEKALRALVDWQIEQGTDGIVPCGTTGEAPTLSYEEHEKVISIVVEQSNRRVPILAGAGSNSTENAIKLTKQAKRAGAHGSLHVTPYYNKPTQQGLYLHYEAIAKAVDLPMMLYNVPGRTAVNMDAATTIRLSKIENIVGTKEAAGNLEQVATILAGVSKNFVVFSGDDALNLQVYALGGSGCISVTANVVPKRVAKVWNLHNTKQKEGAAAEQEALQPLNKVLFIETNPLPAKTALAMMGRCQEEFRLPLCPMEDWNRQELQKVLKQYD